MDNTLKWALVQIQPFDEWIFQITGKPLRRKNKVLIEQDETEYLKSLDPRDWKKQDHYAVLGLGKKRYLASEEEIRKCYRQRVLKHHPDKRMAHGPVNSENDYFACITKAFEILGDPVKRRSYDSVEPEFDDEIPAVNNYTKSNFFEVYRPVFDRNSRWSNTQPVPTLGDENSSREEVEKFYNFWYNFDSWREYSYEDEEEKERGQDRDERRWIEKQNKVIRIKKKKEEMARIRQLTDNAYASDPRILRFKEEEKLRKVNQKKAKEEARKAKQEEEAESKRKAEEDARRLKEEEDRKQRLKKEEEKKEKEALKKRRRNERKKLEQLLDSCDYFASNPEEKIVHLQDFEKICHFASVEDLSNFRKSLESAGDLECRRKLFFDELNRVDSQHCSSATNNLSKVEKQSNGSVNTENGKKWAHDDVQLLIKAVNLFPAGTQNRWEVVAAFITQHSNTGIKRKARDVLGKAKDLQKLDPSVKEEANKKAASKILQTNVNETTAADEAAPSVRYETPAEMHGLNPEPWTNEEQRLLEQALKTYPASTIDRWDRISECIPKRSKKDCMKRYKELVELVKAKKAAAEAAQHKKKP